MRDAMRGLTERRAAPVVEAEPTRAALVEPRAALVGSVVPAVPVERRVARVDSVLAAAPVEPRVALVGSVVSAAPVGPVGSAAVGSAVVGSAAVAAPVVLQVGVASAEPVVSQAAEVSPGLPVLALLGAGQALVARAALGAAGSAPEGGPVPPIEGGVPEGGAPLPPWDDPSCPGGAGSPLLGTWTGYIENYRFESGSDVLKLTITGADTSKICGALTFGDSTPLPPPNPDVAYPPGIDMQKWQPPLPFERFPHTLFNGSVSGKRVRFENRGFEPVRSWCDLQQGYQTYAWDNRYRCVDVPNGSWDTELRSDAGLALICFANDPSTGQKRYIDCGKIHECLSWTVCACNSTGCTAETTSPLNFDAQFDAGEAHGSIALPTPAGTQVFNVHFSKTD